MGHFLNGKGQLGVVPGKRESGGMRLGFDVKAVEGMAPSVASTDYTNCAIPQWVIKPIPVAEFFTILYQKIFHFLIPERNIFGADLD